MSAFGWKADIAIEACWAQSRLRGAGMSLEQLSYAAQVVGTVGVILSLIFVGLQIRQNTAALQRNEHNSTMAQWSVIRMAIAENREIGVLMTSGLNGEQALDTADQLRINQLLAEYVWAAFHIWDRTRRGLFPKGTFELTGGALLCEVLGTPGGEAWWHTAKNTGFIPEYVADVDAMLAANSRISIP